MAQTHAMIRAVFPSGIATIVSDYFKPFIRNDRIAWNTAVAGNYELCAIMLTMDGVSRPYMEIASGAFNQGYLKIVKLAIAMAERDGVPLDLSECLFSVCCNDTMWLLDWFIERTGFSHDWWGGIEIAARLGHVDIFEVLLMYATINGYKITKTMLDDILSSAYTSGNRAMIDRVMALGANDLDGALEGACHGNQLDLVIEMKNRGAKWKDDQHLKSYTRTIDMVRYMIKNWYPHINHCLNEACFNGSADIVKFLLDNGATGIQAAMIQACDGIGDIDILRMLAERDMCFDRIECIRAAARRCNIQAMLFIIDHPGFNGEDIIIAEATKILVDARAYDVISELMAILAARKAKRDRDLIPAWSTVKSLLAVKDGR